MVQKESIILFRRTQTGGDGEIDYFPDSGRRNDEQKWIVSRPNPTQNTPRIQKIREKNHSI